MDTTMSNFEDCLQCLAEAEKVIRRCCENKIAEIKNKFAKSLWEILSCISQTDDYNLYNNGWEYTVTEHDCPKSTACNTFLKLCLTKVPCASRLNRNRFFRAMYLSSSWKFAKLFLEPWMHRFDGFEELDSFCLLVLLDNISSIRQDTPSDSERQKQDLYHAQLGKGRDLAEACYREDIQDLTTEERNHFLDAISNLLAFLPNMGVDAAIGFIVEIRDTTNRDSVLIKRTLEKRTRLQKMRQEFQKMIETFALTIPREEAQTEKIKAHDKDLETQSCFTEEHAVPGVKIGKNIDERKQVYQYLEDYKLIEQILQTCKPLGIISLFLKQPNEIESAYPHEGGEISEENYLCIQGLIHLLEKNSVRDITDIVCSLLGALKLSEVNLDVMPYSHYSKLQDVVKKMETTKPLKTLLKIEIENANVKDCHLALLILESVLKPFCKNNINRIHSDVKIGFPRTNLCQSANQNDICKAKGKASDEIKFRHACIESPDCNMFLDVALSKRSDKCKLKPIAMFKHASPQACLDNEWEFAKLFLEIYMRRWKGFEDLDAFCLLTLITNVQMLDAVKCDSQSLLKKICKVRDSAFAILHDNDTKLSKETRDDCLQEIIDIITILKMTMPIEAGKGLLKIQQVKSERLLFDIRLDLSSREQWIINERTFSNWCKCIYALKYLQPALVPLIRKTMIDQYKVAKRKFGGELCAEVTSKSIERKHPRTIYFRHECTMGNRCSSLISIIQSLYSESANKINMLTNTDPQNWLRSPFDFASLFLKESLRQGQTDFIYYDISALCCMVKKCEPLRELFKETPINYVTELRNRTMHSVTFEISDFEVDERIKGILHFLKMISKFHSGDEVAEAIDLVKQLSRGDFKFSCDEGVRLYEETVASVKRSMQFKRDTTCQNIKQMGINFGCISSVRNNHISNASDHRHEQRTDIKMGWPLNSVYVFDGAGHTPTATLIVGQIATEMEQRQENLPVKKHSDNTSGATRDEVSRRGESSGVGIPYDHGHKHECAQCAEKGNSVSAADFCLDCPKYLCTNCLKHHKILRGTKYHKLLEGIQMPPEIYAPFDVERCKAHTGKPIKDYCADCDTFGCSLCFFNSHKSCHNKGSLSDLSRGVKSSQELLDVRNAAERYTMLENEYKHDIELYLSMNNEWYRQTLDGFQQFQSMSMDNIEMEVNEVADKMREKNKRKLNDLEEQAATFSKELKQCMANITKASQQNEQLLFIALKKHGRVVLESLEHMDTRHKEITINEFSFELKDMIGKSKVNVTTEPFSRPTHTQSKEKEKSRIWTSSLPAITCISEKALNIKSPKDSIECNIMDIMVLSPTKLVLTDWNNKCLKMLNTDSNTIIVRRNLDLQPKDIAKVPESRLAVSFPRGKQIKLFKADHTLDECGIIKVSAECHGLQCSGDRLIVSCIQPSQVQILDMKGQILQTILNSLKARTLFQTPFRLAHSPDTDLIYVSDVTKHTLTCIDMVGMVLWEYRDEQLKGPVGVVNGDAGCIYLCSRDTNTIHVVSPNGVRLAIIPTCKSGIKRPRAACYSSHNRTLYVCNAFTHNNFIWKLNLQ